MQISLQSPGESISQPSNFISKCLQEYQQKLNEQNEFSQYESQDQPIQPQQILAEEQNLKYYGYQDKKSITIKPIKMHKDLISLRKQNAEKKKVIQQLQTQNSQLKAKYGTQMKQNQKVERFLKDIQFTFKNDKKAQKANQIMMKAKKMLYREAIQCQTNTKKITKGPQANTVQQMKMFIEFMEGEKDRLKKMIEVKRRENQQKRQEEDFNTENEVRFECTLERIEKMLGIQMQRVHRRSQVYKIEGAMVGTGLKQKQIGLKKKSIQKSYEGLKDLMLEKQGQEYEIVVLQKKRKDKIKLIEQMKQFKNDITMKKTSIQQWEKQLKQKMKTYDYMSKWTKELKVKLEQKKQNHITNKISYEKKINALSRQFQDWNKKYKEELVEEQMAGINANGTANHRKKGGNSNTTNTNPKKDGFGHSLTPTNHSNPQDYLQSKEYLTANGGKGNLALGGSGRSKKAKLIKIEQIRKLVKKIKLYILIQQIQLEPFLTTCILFSEPSESHPSHHAIQKGNKIYTPLLLKNFINPQTKKPSFMLNPNQPSPKQPESTTPPEETIQYISLKQLFDNLKSQLPILASESDSQIIKLARYIVEDHENMALATHANTIKTADGYVPNTAIPKKLALTIMKKLFENYLKTHKEVEDTKVKLKEFLTKFYDPFRYDILKNLLSMDGLRGIQKQRPEQSPFLQANGSPMMSNMKRNQQLHLQLQLDDAIFLSKLNKHVIEEYYVARFKQVFELMIYEEFGESDRPRLGMFDRVCEIVTQKKLIKENITKDYSFDTIQSIDDCQEPKVQCRLKQIDQPINEEAQQIDGDLVISTGKDCGDSYWIVKPQKKITSTLNNLDQYSKTVNNHYDQDYSDPVNQTATKMQNKHWINDLMSDSDNSDHQI